MEEGKPEWLGGTNCFNLKLRTGFGTFTFPLSAPPWLENGWGTAGKRLEKEKTLIVARPAHYASSFRINVLASFEANGLNRSRVKLYNSFDRLGKAFRYRSTYLRLRFCLHFYVLLLTRVLYKNILSLPSPVKFFKTSQAKTAVVHV